MVEFTSDSESDSENVRKNRRYDVRADAQVLQQVRADEPIAQNIQAEEVHEDEDQGPADEPNDPHAVHQNEDQGPADEPNDPHAVHQDEDQGPADEPHDPHAVQQDEGPGDETRDAAVHEPRVQEQQANEAMENNQDVEAEQPGLYDAEQEVDRLSEDLSDFSEDEAELEDYQSILDDLKSKWLLTEIDHCVSKTATEAFWKLGLLYFPKLCAARVATKKKKTSQFQTLRNKMYNDLVPPIDLHIGYKNKRTGEIVTVHDTVTPIKRFSPNNFEKLFEIGTVKVSII